ncbi:hypothetical protein DERP_002179 [Dermatophagoides pteronyssinus]|uniref:Uncharacterized protein n=1 Tax=Dermatophagoides pteronyssinus TaxID=6956 RepID=A0ABQ8JH33_DERPT|nr:hypothetical protein DERP_002179 [Dermatophagoides pteronyssinus]
MKKSKYPNSHDNDDYQIESKIKSILNFLAGIVNNNSRWLCSDRSVVGLNILQSCKSNLITIPK